MKNFILIALAVGLTSIVQAGAVKRIGNGAASVFQCPGDALLIGLAVPADALIYTVGTVATAGYYSATEKHISTVPKKTFDFVKESDSLTVAAWQNLTDKNSNCRSQLRAAFGRNQNDRSLATEKNSVAANARRSQAKATNR